jgi:hypothetical protein
MFYPQPPLYSLGLQLKPLALNVENCFSMAFLPHTGQVTAILLA